MISDPLESVVNGLAAMARRLENAGGQGGEFSLQEAWRPALERIGEQPIVIVLMEMVTPLSRSVPITAYEKRTGIGQLPSVLLAGRRDHGP